MRWQAVVLALLGSCANRPERPPAYKLELDEGRLRIVIGGALFTEYHFAASPRPFFHPVLGPGGAPMTRGWPMLEGPDDERDHPHQRSLWFAHGDVNGNDFWADGARGGQIVHREFELLETSERHAAFVQRNDWLAHDGKRVCVETRAVTAYRGRRGILLDFDITLHASDGPLRLGDTKEGTMAIRLAPTLRLRGKVAQGHCLNSEGVRDLDVWGKRARWVDYWGPVGGATVGVAILDHPDNHAHPTWWHARDYGLFAANPFGVHDFERKPAGTGDVDLAAGESLRLRYRFCFHAGDPLAAGIEDEWRAFAAGERGMLEPTETKR